MSIPIKKRLMASEEYSKIKSILEMTGRIDVDNLITEIEALHSGRKMRGLKLKSASADKLIDVSCQEASIRSRIVEIVVGITRNYNMLNMAYTAAIETMAAKYYDDLPGSTKANKWAYLENLLSPLKVRLTELGSVTEVADWVISDIDKAQFSLKHIVELVQVANRREHTL